MKKSFFFIISILLCITSFYFYYAIDIVLRFFPLDNPEAVIFTLSHNVGGAQNVIWILLQPCIKKAFDHSFLALSLIGIASMSISLLYLKKQKNLTSLKKILNTAYTPFFLANTLIIVILLGTILCKIPFSPYIKAISNLFLSPSQHNPLYENDYTFPDSVAISFKDRRNLILIFLESMEYNFQDKKNGGDLSYNQIPEITTLIKENLAFEPGGTKVKGTGWTMAEVIAKTCGIPLQTPLQDNTDGIRNYLKNATCLTDILNKNGYEITLVQGTDTHFASMDYFLQTHGVSKKNIYDKPVFEKNGLISDTNFFHGIKDGDLYKEAKKILSPKGTNKQEPWMLWLFTIDTHCPYGRLDSNCVETPINLKREEQYPYVLQCASKQLNNFLNWAKQQEWYENTTIAVMGDHPAMIPPEIAGFSDEKIEHYWLNFFINSTSAPIKDHEKFTSFDMFPTILEAMGVEIKGHALGLGRSLFVEDTTLIEKYGKDSLNSLIETRSLIYNSFWK